MDIVGVTRVDKNGKESDEFVIGCEQHGFWYKGTPPLTHGCKECWSAFFVGQWVQGGAKEEDVDKLESAIRHAAELQDKGLWDFKPGYDIKIDKEIN